MLTFFYRFYKDIVLAEFLDRFKISSDFVKLPTLSKIEICFFFSDLSDLEDLKILNFFQFFEQYFSINKFPFIKKILFVNRKTYKFCVIYTFRKKEAFDILEFFISKINNLSIIERPSLLNFFYFSKNANFFINIKKFTFFDDMTFSGELPKVSSSINIFFENIENSKKFNKNSVNSLKKFLNFLGLNEDIEIKVIS